MFWNCRLQKANQSEHYENAELSNSTNILISLLVFPLRMSVIGRSGACATSAPPFSLLSAHTTAHVTKSSLFKFPNFPIVSTHITKILLTPYITSHTCATSAPPFSLLTAHCSRHKNIPFQISKFSNCQHSLHKTPLNTLYHII